MRAPAANPAHNSPGYKLTSELVKLCLPKSFRDENKKLAWANSICLLFLIVGLIGLRTPKTAPKQTEEPMEIVPVVFVPNNDPLPAGPAEQMPADPAPAPELSLDEPAVRQTVAPNAPEVAFPVPVKGPAVLVPARFAPPPPAEIKKAPAQPGPATQIKAFAQPGPATNSKPPVLFDSTQETGNFPPPTYPRLALQQRQQGKVLIYVIVDEKGLPSSVEVKDSSGYGLLDRHAADWIKSRWHWPPGPTRHYYVPIIFQIKSAG